MILQCPDCQTKLKPKPPAGTKAGAKVVVTCRCGTKLRFTMPAAQLSESAQKFRAQMEEILGKWYGVR